MKLEQQVVSLDIAKRLKELGVKQESLFYHDTTLEKIAWSRDIALAPVDFGDRYISAFTVAELGEMLPRYVVKGGYTNELKVIRSSVWRFYYGEEIFFTAGNDDTEADARGKMLVYLLENKLITL